MKRNHPTNISRLGSMLLIVFSLISISFVPIPAHAQCVDAKGNGIACNSTTATTPASTAAATPAPATASSATTPAATPLPTTGVQDAAGGSAPNNIGNVSSVWGFPDFVALINTLIANIVNTGLSLMGWLVALSGGFLNIAMNLTLNIKAFVDGTAAIYTTWAAIRDICSLFIIFFLLYAAIQMIIGIENPKWGNLIKNIIIAGVLINFSFFLTGLGIDASNIVSLQLYNAIAPAASVSPANLNFQNGTVISSILSAGGMSDIFMQSLQITNVYNVSKMSATNAAAAGVGAAAVNAISAPLKIILLGVTGMIIEFTAACSFTLAAAAFIIRFVILLLLLAFSPILFASFIIPQLSEYSKKWTSTYKSMLLFMPVYLLLMYLALNVLTTSTFFKTGYTGSLVAANASWYSNLLVLGVNAFIVIFLLNMPLVVAISMGGVATKWIDKTGLTAGNIWKKFGIESKKFGIESYKGTIGRATSKISQGEGFREFASKHTIIGGLALKGTRRAASGYDQKLSKQVESKTKFAESLGYDQAAVNTQQANISAARAGMAAGTILPAAGTLAIRMAQQQISTIKNQRKQNYAAGINTRSIDTLLMKRARKNKVAAAKIHLGVWEDQLKNHKDNMKELQSQINRVQTQINAAGGMGAAPATLVAQLNAPGTGLQARQATLQNTIDGLEAQIGQAKLVK